MKVTIELPDSMGDLLGITGHRDLINEAFRLARSYSINYAGHPCCKVTVDSDLMTSTEQTLNWVGKEDDDVEQAGD